MEERGREGGNVVGQLTGALRGVDGLPVHGCPSPFLGCI